MAFFDKFKGRPFQFPSLVNIVIVSVLILVVVQIVGFLFKSLNIFLGPTFQLVVLILSVLLAVYLVFNKYGKGEPIYKMDIFVIMFFIAIALLLFVFLPSLLPEAFNRSTQVLGFG